MKWLKKLSKPNITTTPRKLLILTLCMCFTGASYAQNSAVSESTFESGSKNRRTELLLPFISLYHDVVNNIEIGVSDSDKEIIRNVLNTAPYRADGVRVLESACDYYNSTSIVEIDTDKLALYLADANQAELNSKQAFYEQSYNSLSVAGKNKYNSLPKVVHGSSDSPIDEKQKYFENLVIGGSASLHRSYKKFCNELPEFKNWADSDDNIYVERKIIPTEGRSND